MTAATMAANSDPPKRYSLHSLASVKTAKKNPKPSQDVRTSVHSQQESVSSGTGVDDSWPVHPIISMRGPFQESIIEAMDPDARIRQTIDAATRRLQLLELDAPEEEDYSSRWRKKPGSKFHPLWKLIAQISFGIHLLHQEIAKSEEEVIRILQTHVDEIDGFLEDVGADFDLAMRDIDERLRLLLLPLEHGRTFNRMLRNREFRSSILEGNDVVERICHRTRVAMDKSLEDVGKGVEATAELAKFLGRLGKEWTERDEDMEVVYKAMQGNAEGWYCAFTDIQKKGSKLRKMIRRLERIVSEIERQAGIASRRQTRKNNTTNNATGDKSDGPSPTDETPVSPSKQPSTIASPLHSRTSSSFRDSMNKPLPPDPHRRSSKHANNRGQLPSQSHAHSAQPSLDLRSLLENESRPVKSPESQAQSVEPIALHVHKPSIDLQDILHNPSSLGITLEPTVSEHLPPRSDVEIAVQVPLPSSPMQPLTSEAVDSVPPEVTSTPAIPKEDVSAANLISESVPKALSPELHIPSTPRPKSQVAAQHSSASIVDAYEQAKSPSRNDSQRTVRGSASPPMLTHTGTTASDDSVPQLPESPPTTVQQPPPVIIDATSVTEAAQPKRGVPARVPVGRKASDQKVELAKGPPEPPADVARPVLNDSEVTVDEVSGDSSNQSFRTAQPDMQHESGDPGHTDHVVKGNTPPLRVSSVVGDGSENQALGTGGRISISSVGSIAQESTAVERPQSQSLGNTVHPKRTISMQAFSSVANNFSGTKLPEIYVEPESPGAARTSNESSSPTPNPATPPPTEHSSVRPPPRPGGRSPVSYKLLPDIKDPPPSDHEPLSPKTALPQMPQIEQSRRFRKPSITKFRGLLFKKSQRPGGLSGHVEAA